MVRTLDQAARVVSFLRDVLGDDVLGVCLYGSAAVGGLRPGSDLDLLAVTRRRTTPDERRALISQLLPMSGRGDPSGMSRPIELTIVAQDDVRPWRYPPRLDFQYGDWWRAEFTRGDLAPWESPNADLALLLAMALQVNRPLFGPPLVEMLDAIPATDVRRAMLDSIPSLLSGLDGDESNVVLTFARIWTTLATGAFRSKDAAADWALPRLPPEHREVLAHARAIYLGEAVEAWAELQPQVGLCVDQMVGAIRRVEARTSRYPGKRGNSRRRNGPGTVTS